MPETNPSPDKLRLAAGVLVRGRWHLLLTLLTVTLATVGVLYRIPNRFTSEATLLVVPQQVPARYVTPTSETNIADALQAMTQDVLSRARLMELIEQFGLYPRERRRLAPEELIALMRKQIEIRPLDPAAGHKDINSFRISFVADKAALAQEVTSKLTSFFIQANLRTREDQATNTTNFLREQLEATKARLAVQEDRVRDFKTQYLGELPEQQQGYLAILSGAQLQLQNLGASLDRAQQQRVYLNSLLSSYRRVASRAAASPAPAAPDGSGRPVTALRLAEAELARLRTEQASLLNRYKPTHPDVVANRRAIAAAELQVATLAQAEKAPRAGISPSEPVPPESTTAESAEDDNATAQLRSQLEANRLEIEHLTRDEAQQKSVIAEYQKRLNLTPVREQQLAGILRDYENSKKDYADLLGKEQQSQLAMSLEKQQGGEQFHLVEPPSLPALPSSPNRLKLGMGGVAAGLVLGLLAALLRDLARPAFYSAGEIAHRFSAPLVIAIPVLRTPAETRRRIGLRLLEGGAAAAVLGAVGAAGSYVLRHP